MATPDHQVAKQGVIRTGAVARNSLRIGTGTGQRRQRNGVEPRSFINNFGSLDRATTESEADVALPL
jgi:hypothetical protein